ncbi:MAG: hypothetical protein A3K03_11315 [Bdellovibrionales bacterium RIFOXYD1_FULL_44_7]|nr:MAG: hypothetical protein A3K03_11315 [Bdellovibrionales bacterium RIFOXYD1_FULL_44_7]
MQSLNWRRPLALAAALLILGSFTYWLEYTHKPKKEETEGEAKKIFALRDSAVEFVKLIDGKKTFSFRCLDLDQNLCKPGDNSKWETTEPLKLRADDSNVNSLLTSISNLKANETIDLSIEPADKKAKLLNEYGLSQSDLSSASVRRVEVTTKSGQKTVAYLGETHPIGDSIFAIAGKTSKNAKNSELKLDDNKVLLIPTFFKSTIDHDLTYWRDKKLFTMAVHQIDSFQLNGKKAKLTAERKDGNWTIRTLTSQDAIPGDIENIDNLLNAVTALTAKRFVSEKRNDQKWRAALAKTKPVLTMTVNSDPQKKGEKKSVTLTLFEKKGKANTTDLYATVSNLDPLFELNPSEKERLDKDVKDLRLSKLITSMERFTVKRLEFSGTFLGSSPLILSNKDGKWQTKDEKSEVSSDKVQNLLDRLSGNRISQFLQGKEVPIGADRGLLLVLGDESNEKKRQFVFWKSENRLYAKDLTATGKEAFLVDNAINDALPWNRDFFSKNVQPSPVPKKGKERKKG